MDFETKDSGKREQFTSGMVRDTQDGKTNFALVFSGPMLERWAALLTRGAKKYERDNWMKASGPAELQRFQESAARHFAQWMRGDTDEDHAAAVYFNICGAEYVKERMREEENNYLNIPGISEDDALADLIKRQGTEGLRSAMERYKATQSGPSIPQGAGYAPTYKGIPIEQILEWERDLQAGCYCVNCEAVHKYREFTLPVRPVDNA